MKSKGFFGLYLLRLVNKLSLSLCMPGMPDNCVSEPVGESCLDDLQHGRLVEQELKNSFCTSNPGAGFSQFLTVVPHLDVDKPLQQAVQLISESSVMSHLVSCA